MQVKISLLLLIKLVKGHAQGEWVLLVLNPRIRLTLLQLAGLGWTPPRPLQGKEKAGAELIMPILLLLKGIKVLPR